jgi:glycosyltransferase involved in cell wall biosynthesis
MFVADKHREMGFTGNFHHLPYYIPSAEKTPAPKERKIGEKPYFLFIGRLEKLKGLQTLITIFK